MKGLGRSFIEGLAARNCNGRGLYAQLYSANYQIPLSPDQGAVAIPAKPNRDFEEIFAIFQQYRFILACSVSATTIFQAIRIATMLKLVKPPQQPAESPQSKPIFLGMAIASVIAIGAILLGALLII